MIYDQDFSKMIVTSMVNSPKCIFTMYEIASFFNGSMDKNGLYLNIQDPNFIGTLYFHTQILIDKHILKPAIRQWDNLHSAGFSFEEDGNKIAIGYQSGEYFRISSKALEDNSL
ncbi:hypothetical protein MMG00_10680 [Ignatzschineria rhizosphaerae]|uniref:Uncharacterized protein n=1 Tax=Ignatzschineria rhizosphaerae TaxID=2923279 RepID=A0ABY3X1V2_9GAMM|nr:hypothetical protein [Ignatzschineria rhizosphaerae]UNM95674.1 hypothetical protein MMG00_10680 [Ignatzschineria rhizosphaerae]